MNNRLLSLDALRGADMFFIAGGEGIVLALAALFPASPFMQSLATQMEHVEWNGFHMMDLVFPLFLFIAGATFPLSMAAQRSRGKSKGDISLRIVRRALTLVALGLVYNGLLHCTDLATFRYASVLARIGLAWMLAALMWVWCSRRTTLAAVPAILLGYWALLVAFPVEGMDPYSMEGSLVGRIDRALLPGRLYLGVHDPEGILGILPATATALLGAEAGRWLTDTRRSGARRALTLAAAGVAAIAVAWAWDVVMPINKNLWTSSFVMVTAGWSAVLLAVFFYVIDVAGWRRWAFVPAVIGMNSITIYIGQELISFHHTARALFTLPISLTPEALHPLLGSVAYVVTVWVFLYILYRNKIFLKV